MSINRRRITVEINDLRVSDRGGGNEDRPFVMRQSDSKREGGEKLKIVQGARDSNQSGKFRAFEIARWRIVNR